ncbi:hypothetical protein HN51_006051 [Arachis hypogaea]|uniref:Uncharacterized protein n=2 Tax=Arachis hypogaea TaxID=3818 RepID=A0A445DCC0_ARAHY|nr:uncharacterized protein LOC112797649 [Arachis hypogaea]QHO39916.1 Transmembrane protein, putative [Arachis hypogaea]RYR60816.1 hypothetical protein Ahy_A04g017880 [Arachis hypogaea]
MKMDNGVQRDMEEVVQAHKKSSKTTSTDAENVDPLTTNISSEKGFLHSLWSEMKEMVPSLRFAIFSWAALTQGLHLGPAKRTATLGFQAGNFSDTDQNYVQALFKLFPEMVDMATFIGCFILGVILFWREHPGARCFLMPIMMHSLLYYLADLARKTSGIAVNCKTFKMPAIWFVALGGVAISFVTCLNSLVVLLCKWLYNNKRGVTVREE